MIGRRAPRRIVAVAAVTIAGLSACSGGRSGPPGINLGVTIQDFRITTSSPTVLPGTVVLHVHDQGPSTHELVIVRTDLPADQLPLRPDGLLVDEESPQLQAVDELSELDVGDRARLVLNLSPGRYVLFCNLEGHYLGGMHFLLRVGSNQDEGDSGA
jgi:uncharacterized cupredoxin-like copper-binding protein